MSDKLQKKLPDSVKEHSQYALGFGLIATMLYLANFPGFVIFFFAIFAYVLWKTFSQPPRNETREIFEFYLSANELLRDDERRWFGFEVQEVIARGERILQLMNGAPPLVYFTLGALYNKAGDYKSAVNHLAYVLENENADETTYAYPSPDLRNYVRILRKIEREPSEAPQTSAAIRALERARRTRGKIILENSRISLMELDAKKQQAQLDEKKQKELAETNSVKTFVSVVPTETVNGNTTENSQEPVLQVNNQTAQKKDYQPQEGDQHKKKTRRTSDDPFAERKPISELLHDIYDSK